MVVLVVEDEVIIAYCSAAILAEAGIGVLGPAHTSSEALKLARSKRPDVALVDIDLEFPGAGIGVARQLRALYGTAIVFTTGRMDQARDHSDIAAAALSKPYDPSELPGIVKYAASLPRGRVLRCRGPRRLALRASPTCPSTMLRAHKRTTRSAHAAACAAFLCRWRDPPSQHRSCHRFPSCRAT